MIAPGTIVLFVEPKRDEAHEPASHVGFLLEQFADESASVLILDADKQQFLSSGMAKDAFKIVHAREVVELAFTPAHEVVAVEADAPIAPVEPAPLP